MLLLSSKIDKIEQQGEFKKLNKTAPSFLKLLERKSHSN